MATWEEWAQNVGGNVINSAVSAKYQQPYDIQKLRLQALGEVGIYDEGQPIAKSHTAGTNPT